jgi:cytochrome c-type biogenesis protein CcmH
MAYVLAFIFVALFAIAAGFVCWPLLRRAGTPLNARLVLSAAACALVLGIGGGAYLMLGHPNLALRALTGPADTDYPGLVAKLAERVRERPDDLQAWLLLGRGYLMLRDPSDAAAALKRAIPLVPPPARGPIYSAYGQALTLAGDGAVTPEAEAAFDAAIALNPRDIAARYFLGSAYAARHDTAAAIRIWEGLLADTPPGAPWRGELVDRLAALKGQSGAVPDIAAMVAGLAARLHDNPGDSAGWQRLVRSYAVLGDLEKAKIALADARAGLKNNPAALAALTAEAKGLKLEK